MKYFISLLVLLPVISASAWQEVQNAGGGVSENGTYMSFFSAHVPVVPVPLERSEIPGLEFLLKKVMAMPMTMNNRHKLISLLYPTASRNYYKAEGGKVDEALTKSLLQEYSRLTGMTDQALVLFAVTNPKVRDTVLLPAFYELKKETEQAALILHEAAWLQTIGTYTDVVRFEMTSQAYMESDGRDDVVYYKFFGAFDNIFQTLYTDESALIYASILRDVEKGYLKSDNLKPGQVRLKDIVSRKYLDCLMSEEGDPDFMLEKCNGALSAGFMTQSQANSKSLFLKFLNEKALTLSSSVVVRFNTMGFNNFRIAWNKIDLDKIYVDFKTDENMEAPRFIMYAEGSKSPIGAVIF